MKDFHWAGKVISAAIEDFVEMAMESVSPRLNTWVNGRTMDDRKDENGLTGRNRQNVVRGTGFVGYESHGGNQNQIIVAGQAGRQTKSAELDGGHIMDLRMRNRKRVGRLWVHSDGWAIQERYYRIVSRFLSEVIAVFVGQPQKVTSTRWSFMKCNERGPGSCSYCWMSGSIVTRGHG